MLSYIFMKILEKRPERYDAGIGSQSGKIRDEIISEYVKPGIKMLDLGCGTGELVEKSAKIGADVSGLDISKGMLNVAKNRIEKLNLEKKVKLYHSESGMVEMNALFEDNSFDLVTSTLLISELYDEELSWLLKEIRRILKPSGTVVIAGEVVPGNFFKRILYFFSWLPMAIFTYIISQTGTKAVKNLSEKIKSAGLEIVMEKHFSFFESSVLISARKDSTYKKSEVHCGYKQEKDISVLRTIWDYIGRWFPGPVAPGLRVLGNPDENSPVIVTSNYHLTVRCVEKSLANTDCYLLVAPTGGINVWCAACGGELTTLSIIRVVKTSGISDLVNCHKLILPQFCAPGVDRNLLFNKIGWKSVFGPAYAKELPEFLAKQSKTLKQTLSAFPLNFRCEMLLSMNILVWALVSIVLFFINPLLVLYFGCVFWIVGLILYIGFPFIPGKSGILKAFQLSVIVIIAIIVVSLLLDKYWLAHWGWMISVFLTAIWFGFDLRGIVGGFESEAEHILYKLGIKSFGRFFSVSAKSFGKIKHNTDKCNNCCSCINVCPQGVFEFSASKKVILQNPEKCFTCNACIKQCPKKALSI